MKAWEISLKVFDYMSGYAVAAMIQQCAKLVEATHVLVENVDGFGEKRALLCSNSAQVLSVGELIDRAKQLSSFDWGDFYFFGNTARLESMRNTEGYPARIAEAPLLLRCVDGSYFHLYGTDMNLCDNIRAIINVTIDEVEHLRFAF